MIKFSFLYIFTLFNIFSKEPVNARNYYFKIGEKYKNLGMRGKIMRGQYLRNSFSEWLYVFLFFYTLVLYVTDPAQYPLLNG